MLEKRIETFDPRVSSDSAAERMRQLIFNGLTRKDDKFNPAPDLAERFESSPDFRAFTFYLRPNIKFHNGQALSAADVKYTFDTMMAPGFRSSKRAELERDLASIDLDPQNPLKVTFQCKNSCPGLPNTILPVGIIPEGTSDQQARRPVGTGPFKFVDYTEDQEVNLAAFNEYFEGASSIKRLSVRIIPDNSTRESELRKGSADLAINADFDPVTVEGLQKAEGIKVEVMDGTNITHLGVNLQDPILKDRRIRRALAYAIDREAIIRDVLRGQARPANSVLPPSQWAYEPGVVNYKYDPEMAKKLLGEAGKIARDGQPRIKLSLKTSPLSISRKIGEALQEQMRRVGVEIELQPLERQKLTQDMSDGNFQLYLNILVGGNQSADIFKYVYSSRSIPPNGQNRSRYDNPQLDKLLDEAQMASKDRSREIFSQAQKILSEDLPQIYLWYPATIVVHRDRVSNVKMDPSGDWRVVRSMTAGDRL
ncbi:MAG: ABC transporter substrate-binding protein [Anaerolineae bacterium]|nr:ABC transporter substrate-binding protein [Anaerolineae bacterium]